jgi:hypothetical protein
VDTFIAKTALPKLEQNVQFAVQNLCLVTAKASTHFCLSRTQNSFLQSKILTKWWTIKRSLLAETRNASLREIMKKAGISVNAGK